MLAGCSSSTLLSPRHRIRSESPAQFQACPFPSMSTQRLDLPCSSFVRKDTNSRSQPTRPPPATLSVDKPIEARSLKHNIRRDKTEDFWNRGKSLKRFAEQNPFEDVTRAKRKRGSKKSDDSPQHSDDTDNNNLRLGQLGGGNFWFDVHHQSVPLFAGLHCQPPAQPPFSLSSCPREEERACFVPPDLVTEITNLGDKNLETPLKEASGSSSTSSDSQNLALKLNDNTLDYEIGNGSGPSRHTNQNAQVIAGGNGGNHEDHDGFELISLLMACVEAIGSKNIAGINLFVGKLGELASPRGSSISRLTAYFTEALALRVARLWPHIFHITTPRELNNHVDDDSDGTALMLLNQVTPIPKFIHFTSNEILLRSFQGKDRVHIIDFDIKQGLQWPSLFQSLASSANPPSHVRITGIGESKQDLIETGERLAGFAGALNLPFEFHPVVDRLEDVRLWMLHVKERECVAVNCIFQLHKMLYDGNGGVLRDFLGLIRSTNPTIVVMAEQEAEHNDTGFEARLSNSLNYYSAIFDLIDSSLPMESPVRINVEEMFAREIRNIIACEGRERFARHESFGKWMNSMEQGGFRCMGITEKEYLQSQMLLKMYSFENYRVEKKEQGGGAALTLSWLDQPLYTVSAWAPVDFAGSSSSYSQPN